MNLNWKEWQILIEAWKPKIEGSRVEKIGIPLQPHLPGRFQKCEWAFRLNHPKHGNQLCLWSVRPQVPFFGLAPWAPTSTLPETQWISEGATHSPFELLLRKTIRGQTIRQIAMVPEERILWIQFDTHALAIHLMPARPNAFLLSPLGAAPFTPGTPWQVEMCARVIDSLPPVPFPYTFPERKNQQTDLKIRSWVQQQPDTAIPHYRQEELHTQFEAQKKTLVTQLSRQRKLLQNQTEQAKESLNRLAQDPHWQSWGNLLKANLYLLSDRAEQELPKTLSLEDPATGLPVTLKLDPALTLNQQMARFYSRQKRGERKKKETASALEILSKKLEKIESMLHTLETLTPEHWAPLQAIQQSLLKEAAVTPGSATTALPAELGKKIKNWDGKCFVSQEGIPILVGRNQEENRKLVFKIAKGSDLWFHLRGQPSAHVVALLPPKKSASLDTLLDAAHLVLYYSKGEKWGKTEVDYTHCKFVKTIKGSTEFSYSQNKTLFVAPESQRLDRLLDRTHN